MSTSLYSLRVEDVYRALETSPDGIAAGEVSARQALYGPNLLHEEERFSSLAILASHLTHPMALILWSAGVLAFINREPVLGLTMWALVLVNAGFSFWREYRTEQALHSLRQLLPAYARLIRGGQEVQVPASEVVPGDVLVLAEGDNIPADGRVVEAYGLRTNDSALTGEATPARKSADASVREGISELERPNLVFAGTSVVGGTGRAVVYATGMLTQFGRIAHLTQSTPAQPSPLQRELARFTRNLSLAGIGIGGLVFAVSAIDLGYRWSEALLLALGILVAVVPEGLPATLTLTLALAAQRLAQRRVLVKKLSVLETLGTVSTICTDKSGTLTQNQMTVRALWVARQQFQVSGVGYEPSGRFTPEPNGRPGEADLRQLMVAAALCNNSRLSPPTSEHPRWSSLGDQTEAALHVAALKAGIDEERLAQSYPRLHELPFDARRKRMSTIHLLNNGYDPKARATIQPLAISELPRIAFVKGAPREVLQLCDTIQLDGHAVPLSDDLRVEIMQANDQYAQQALRVIALAQRQLPAGPGEYLPEKIERDLTFLGLMAMHDPPRPEVAQAVQACRQAGIRMIMVTGDYGLTAESLARRVGMLTTPNPLIVTGGEVEAMDEQALKALLDQEVIFARMAPEHKLRLVAALQARGEVIAVTGDGVNDAPALRRADVGVAMGLTGTDVAKEAADLILVSDHFADIVSAIEEGRAVYDNLRKFMTYIFSSNVPEILPFLLTALFNLPLALTVRQILAIDLGTDMLPALGLGMEKPEPHVMKLPPRRKDQPLLDRSLFGRAFLWLGLIEAALAFSGFALIYGLPGMAALWSRWLPGLAALPLAQRYILAVTAYHAGVVMAQVGNAFASRTEVNRGRSLGWLSNRYLLAGVLVEIALILALIYQPALARLFQHAPLPPAVWLWLGLYAPALYTLDWIRKAIKRKMQRLQAAALP
jgi:Ca2+-transporting ATPase